MRFSIHYTSENHILCGKLIQFRRSESELCVTDIKLGRYCYHASKCARVGILYAGIQNRFYSATIMSFGKIQKCTAQEILLDLYVPYSFK